MKKIVFFCISLLILLPSVEAENVIPSGTPPSEKISAELIKCDSISNVWLKYNDQIKRVQLIAFDSEDGKFNKEINEYFCTTLSQATKIEVEYDVESTDKYNRELLFIYADDYLVQEKLISRGYGQVNFIKANYKYLDELCTIQKQAIIEGLGIWTYPQIKEKYCNCGVEIGSKETNQDQIKIASADNENKLLQTILFINSGILVLLLLLRRHS